MHDRSLCHLRRTFGIVLVAACAAGPVPAESLWSASFGAEADDSGAHVLAADMGWSPSEKLFTSLALGTAQSDEDQGDFRSRTTGVALDWWPTRHLGLALDYALWSDSDSYEKQTARVTGFLEGDRFRVGLIAEAVDSETTAALGLLLRREITFAFDGSGYGLDLQLTGERFTAYASYIGYDYDEDVQRLLTFLANPALATRPRLEGLLESGLTAAAALLDRSMIAGIDWYVGDRRVGLAWSQVRDVIENADTNSLQADVEWPVSPRWSARLTGGLSDSEGADTTFFAGARFLFYSR